MLKRYNQLINLIEDSDPDLTELIPSPVEKSQISKLEKDMSRVNTIRKAMKI